jgi:ABC-2 type transport system permease protein
MKWHRIQALLLKFWYISKNRVDRIFDIFYWPLLDVLIWGFASTYIEDLSSVNVLSVFLGAIMLWLFLWRPGQDIAVFALEEFWSKSLYHLYSSPVRLSEHIVSMLIVGVLRAGVSFLFLASLVFILYGFNIFSLPLMTALASLALLTLIGWAVGFFVTGCVYRWGQRIQVLAWSVIWVLQPFSCVFYPLETLPNWAYPIAIALPTTHVFENLREVLIGQGEGSLLYAFVATVVLLIVASWFIKRSFEHARKTGLLARAE